VRIDLHIHSTASDGTLWPSEILTLAQDLNIAAISITDHDTLEGSKNALSCGIPSPLKFLTGVEISADPPDSFSLSGSLHILGYAVDVDHPDLNQKLFMLKDSRGNRNPRILRLLSGLGIEITFDELRELAEKSALGRPHIARLMVKKGYVPSIDAAFDQYLGHGKPAYVDRFRFGCEDTIRIILDAGGIPVLAHPMLLGIQDNDIFEDFIAMLTEMGMRGIEVYYPEHTKDLMAYYTRLARRHNLLITGGTDFHGDLNPEIKMGSGTGDLYIPYELYEKLISSLMHS
jgi:predicted metal-dependent phosphoesterase TrpH